MTSGATFHKHSLISNTISPLILHTLPQSFSCNHHPIMAGARVNTKDEPAAKRACLSCKIVMQHDAKMINSIKCDSFSSI